jgi:hypothetical protein
VYDTVVLTPEVALPCHSVPVVVAPPQLMVPTAAATTFRQRTVAPVARPLTFMRALLLLKSKLRELVPLTVLLQ